MPQLLKHAAFWTILLLITFTNASQAELLYSSNGSTITITGSNPQATGALVIPSKINNLPVTKIGERAFAGSVFILSELTSVTIPNSVTVIGEGAFYWCSRLMNITVDVANSFYTSDNGVLFNKAKTSLITFPAGKTGDYTIPNSVSTIGYAAFARCSGLTSVSIPNSVSEIGYQSFYGCSGLTSVSIPNSVYWIGEEAFRACRGLTSVSIPNSVTYIGNNAFAGCSGLTSVTIPNSVTLIAEAAFGACSGLTSVSIPNSVTEIGNNAFAGCRGLTSVTIPNSVTSIGYGAFSECTGLTSVTIPNSVTSIGYGTFAGCSGLTSVTIPNSVTKIGERTFAGCSGLTSVTIPNSVSTIDYYAFYGCSGLTSVCFMGNAPWTPSDVFYNANKVTVYYIQGKTGWGATFAGRPTAAFKPLAISVQPLPLTLTAGSPASFTVTATGNGPLSYQWAKDGVSIPKATNQTFSFATTTLTNSGLYQVIISNPQATLTSLTAQLTVNPPTPVITSSATASATVGQLVSHTITANNAPTQFTATGLPAGLSLNSVTGVISGKPTTAGTATITLSAINPFGTGSQTLTLTVYPAPILTITQDIARNSFSLLVKGEPNQEHVIEYTTNFQQWVPLATNIVGATDWTLEYPQATQNPHRFYRVFKR